jgi:eukaryotic-like serine/threonine-protein kinase
MRLTPGLRLTGRYTLRERIGRGGMSEVWRADDEVLGRSVAVKALTVGLTQDPALRAAIWREARAAARLTHPHVTQTYDYGEAHLDGGPPVAYLVMELVQGQNLADRLAAGPLPWVAAAGVSAQVAAALAAAHRQGVVHRDIKPGNVMLTATGAKVLDFGIAALPGTLPDADGGRLFGTPAYAAPERLDRAAPDPAGDVYSLGALMYEALTARTPLPVSTWVEAARAHRRREAPAPLRIAGLPGDAAALCMACLSADPAGRPTADEMAARLGRAAAYADPASTAVPPAGPSDHPPTLVDRPSPHLVQRAPSGTSDGRGAARIAGSAAVVPRPALADDADLRPVDGPGRSRLAVVGVAGAVIAAGLTVTLVAPALLDERGAAPVAGATATAGSAAPIDESAPTASPKQPRPTTPEGVIAEADRILREAAAGGQIGGDVARELRNELDSLRDRLADGRREDFVKRADRLLEKVREWFREGDIPAQTAARLGTLLQPYADRSEDGNGDD